jgi:FKBP-type peptidyl-prolyl cis-trans isomerase
MPQVEHTDDSVHSLVDVDSPHISSVPSDYDEQSVKTDTQAERMEREEAEAEQAKQAKQAAEHKAEQAKKKAARGKELAKENADNPVVIGNAVVLGLAATVLGVGAYRKWSVGELSWKVAGAWMGVVGAFGVADFYVSK